MIFNVIDYPTGYVRNARMKDVKGEDSQPSDCVVIENRTVVQQLHRNQKNNTGIPRPSTTKRPSEPRSGQKPSRSSDTPRSPLMTVARSVKNKFSKLTRMGRHEQDVSMKGSQSFSGIRQPKASVPKRIDQNANRVIKSSSMDVASTSQDASAASTSKHMVVIPQNPARLEDFSEEASLAEQAVQKENEDPEQREEPAAHAFVEDHLLSADAQQAVSMTLSADVLVVTKEALATPHTKKKQLERELEEAREESEPLDDRNEKFVLTTSTPLAMRKFQTFMIEDKKPAEQPVKSHTVGNFDAIANLEREAEITEEAPLKTSDMYVLTTMTPLPQRKERASESHLERIAREKSRSTSRSPEKGGLFIMGNRSSRSYYHVAEKEATAEKEAESVKCAVVQPQRAALGLESPRKERSQSDNAEPIERKASCSSGEMTSPEEEIPMDTHLTPTEEDKEDALIIRPIRRPPEVTSPIAEEPEVSASLDVHEPQRAESTKVREVPGYGEMETRPPVFRPPSPPKEMYKPITSSRSTSPLRRKESSEKSDLTAPAADGKSRARLTVRSKSEDRKDKKAEEKERERSKKGKREERERDKERLPKSPKMPITASILRSLRSAGKMLAPSFFRKGESKIPKSSKPTASPPTMAVTKPRMSLPFRNGRRAPLAEFESLVVEDSPAVENHPLTFEKWNNSPRGKRRHSAHVNGFSEPIVEESDGNGNVSAPVASRVECVMSPAIARHEPDRGLIDDEILDQPMLVGDTFSHSESIDCLSAVRRMEFEAEKATLISIDRSLIEDSDTIGTTRTCLLLRCNTCLGNEALLTARRGVQERVGCSQHLRRGGRWAESGERAVGPGREPLGSSPLRSRDGRLPAVRVRPHSQVTFPCSAPLRDRFGGGGPTGGHANIDSDSICVHGADSHQTFRLWCAAISSNVCVVSGRRTFRFSRACATQPLSCTAVT
ncbi:hypothetical protein Y032_0047g1526 [Ancylostoma ceylanicum]|uniref:Uncharacterized protein n=2 Tax=Ancylostoma ceylanicum TaxID=53326 RepID=A0A016UD49_9BILA|nr:hypothetical protein Y032_0047g1526 [Ancylostoma ceylanicum]